MADVGRHPKITLLTLSEVVDVKGYVGNFDIRILKKSKYVDESECTACGDCATACPVVFPDEFNAGLASRKAVFMPFPQAVPASYLINMNECLGHGCTKCADACEKRCIDFHMSDEEIKIRVGSIVVATGMEAYDPREMDEYGYTRFDNILSSVEFERMVNAGGPTQGQLVRPTDRRHPRSVGFIQCVGSRSRRKGGLYCSNTCCMNTIKSTLVLKEHDPDIDITVYYMDIRAFGKGFEDLYNRSRSLGVRYVRGLPGNVEETAEKGLRVAVENTSTGKIEFHDLDMLVLAVGMKPSPGTQRLQEMLGLQLTPDGFYLEAHPKLLPVDAATRGVFYAGCAEGPKDIKESVTQGSAAAGRAIRLMHRGVISSEPITSEVIAEHCSCCGKCAEVCPYNAIAVDVKKKIPAVVNSAACAGCGTCAAECAFGAIVMNHFTDDQILSQSDAMLADNPGEKILTFACNWCSYAGADYAGVSRLQYPPNARLIRTMCSGRVDEKFIWHAFAKGAPVVLVSGCHIGDCHYIDANHWTEKRVAKIHRKMEKAGIRTDRLQLEWISAAEGIRFANVMAQMEAIRKTVTPEEIAATIQILKEKRGRCCPEFIRIEVYPMIFLLKIQG
jgi:heterodisulfide reductase subunit A2